MELDRDRVVRTMREILRNQCSFSYMPREIVGFIFDNALLKLTKWPAWLIWLTAKGRAYILDTALQNKEE